MKIEHWAARIMRLYAEWAREAGDFAREARMLRAAEIFDRA